MNGHLRNLFAFYFLLLAASATQGGQIDARLEDRLRRTPSIDRVKVWIRIVEPEAASTFKRSVDQASASRATRHAIALSGLKQKAQSQAGLLADLDRLVAGNRASAVKGHWIAAVIEAEVAAGELAAIAARDDVEAVYEAPIISLIEPDKYQPAPDATLSPQASEPNLTHINAPGAWDLGYTGAGRLVCSFDTGIYGSHPYFAGRWKGKDGDSAASWFDPVYNLKVPHTVGSSGTTYWHGTHVMGIMVGYNEGGDYHYGVAPGAKWISAAVIDIPGASILDAFEWAADPDGDPNTVDDVPDVINHSWGYPNVDCANIFYDAIDNTEALGIVNVFAAGNDGATAASIRNPADRALDSIDCFAVGNLNATTNVITASSSRGPSPCNPSAYKPNVVAPGTSIVSCYPGGTTSSQGGTSQAAPHVSGLVALLRQKNPDATVDQIKTAILTSTQNRSWGELPNNTYGWGEIDCVAALAALPTAGPSPSIRVYDLTHVAIQPGDVVTATVVLQNLGASAGSVSATLSTSNAAVTVLDGSVSFGAIAAGDTVRSADYLQVQIADTVTAGTLLPVDLTINGTSPSYVAQAKIYFLVETEVGKAIVTHSGNRIEFALSNFGVFGFADDGIFPLGGVGFTFNGSANQLYEGGVITGVGFGQVSSGVHSLLFDPDMDFTPAPGGSLVLSDPGSVAAQQSYGRFDDSRAVNPMGLLVTQESFYYDPPNDDFLTLKYIVKNTSGATLSSLYFGLFLDYDVVSYSSNAGGYDTDGDLTWMAYYNGSTYSNFRGVCLLEGPLGAAGAIGQETYDHYPPIGSPAGSGFDAIEKYSMITSALLYSESNKTAQKDLFLITSAGPLTLAPQTSDTVIFALLAGATLPDITAAAERARAILTDVEDPGGEPPLPESFSVHQNYPNPFNPTTMLAFDMPRKQSYVVEVFNTLGQTVFRKEAVDGPGRIEVEWSGDNLASGAYFYRVTADGRSQARKMMLIK